MKKSLVLALVLMLLFALTGCGKDSKNEVTTNENSMVDIYYPNGNSVVKSDEKYQIKQPDSVSYSVEELMACIMNKLDSSIEYNTYLIDADNNVTLQFVCNDAYDREYFLLAKASVVETLFQIEAINSVNIKVFDKTGTSIGDNLYLRDSFYFYDYEDEFNMVKVDLYYPDFGGTSLVKEEKDIYLQPNITVEESIVNILSEAGALPEGTKVKSVSVNGDICYVDFNDKFNEEVEGVKSEAVVYSVVNSITSLSKINNVQITINGEDVKLYRETVDISKPLQFNSEILK